MSQRLIVRVARKLRRVSNRLLYRAAGGENRPTFFEIDDVNPGLARIAENYDVIREELVAILPKTAGIPRYHEIDGDQREISAESDGDWRVLMLELKGAGERLPNRKYCPRTCAVLAEIPNVLQAFFSIMSPGKYVPPHNGVSLGFLRYHMAFVVPAVNPPTIRVKDRFYTWKERECMIFDDTWEHEIKNEAEGVRVVLIIDVPRPMPWYLRPLDALVHRLDQESWDEEQWLDVFERVEVKAVADDQVDPDEAGDAKAAADTTATD